MFLILVMNLYATLIIYQLEILAPGLIMVKIYYNFPHTNTKQICPNP